MQKGCPSGSPLSPLIFVLAVELLQILINRAASQGLLCPPIPQGNADYPVIQYANDTLLIMQADARQLFFLKALLRSFSDSTGLKVNVSQDRMQILANTFGCQIERSRSHTSDYPWAQQSHAWKTTLL